MCADRPALSPVDAGKSESRTKITPEMIEAGADVIWRGFGDVMPYGSALGREMALEVYQAMACRYAKEISP